MLQAENNCSDGLRVKEKWLIGRFNKLENFFWNKESPFSFFVFLKAPKLKKNCTKIFSTFLKATRSRRVKKHVKHFHLTLSYKEVLLQKKFLLNIFLSSLKVFFSANSLLDSRLHFHIFFSQRKHYHIKVKFWNCFSKVYFILNY